MKIIIFYLLSLSVKTIVSIPYDSLINVAPSMAKVNLTHWREHRRQKRFLIYQNTGVCKLVTGITFPVQLPDKRPWRQLVVAMNIQYQFQLPTTPIYWWDKWDRRNFKDNDKPRPADSTPPVQTDGAQQFLYAFAENLMDRRETNGRECLLKAICENAQIHEHQGLYAELLHRFLKPHRNLKSHYLEAWHKGQHGVDCLETYPKAKKCLLDKHTHVREEFMAQTTVK